MPNPKAESAKVSQVLSKPMASFIRPPMIGPTIVPIAPAVLNKAEALSLMMALSCTYSFSSMASITSESRGTNTVAVVIPSKPNAVMVIGIFPYGNPNIFDGPSSKSEMNAKKKEN